MRHLKFDFPHNQFQDQVIPRKETLLSSLMSAHGAALATLPMPGSGAAGDAASAVSDDSKLKDLSIAQSLSGLKKYLSSICPTLLDADEEDFAIALDLPETQVRTRYSIFTGTCTCASAPLLFPMCSVVFLCYECTAPSVT